jgi:cytochrome d ubiquinol oxidase subunit I
VLFIIEMTLMLAAIRKGPEEDHEPEQKLLAEALKPAE